MFVKFFMNLQWKGEIFIMKKIIFVVIDALGIGSFLENKSEVILPNSLGHVLEKVGSINIPTLTKWGLGNIIQQKGIKILEPSAAIGRTKQLSNHCESFSAHWEFSGCVVNNGYGFPNGFPKEIISKYENAISKRTLGNVPLYDNFHLIDKNIIDEHIRTGYPIIATIPEEESLGTFAIFGCDTVISSQELLSLTLKAKETFKSEPMVGRIISKRFQVVNGNIKILPERYDLHTFNPPSPNLLDKIKESGRETISTGKVNSLFNEKGFTKIYNNWDPEQIWKNTIMAWQEAETGFIWANLNDLDSPYGHKKDINGWVKSLERFDYWLSVIESMLTKDDLLIVAGDHGCDPVYYGDHTFEWNPLIIVSPSIKTGLIGDWNHIDLAASINELWNLDFTCNGNSFIKKIGL